MKDFKEIKKWLADADAVIVTAGNGFAQMEGLDMFDNLTFPIEYKNIREKVHLLRLIKQILRKYIYFYFILVLKYIFRN